MVKHKLYENIEALSSDVRAWKEQGFTVVMTNGVFDILHKGHVSYLQQAKSKGDKLIVAVNTDESVRKLKGDSRPIQECNDRMTILSALESVDAVVAFDEDTPIKVVERLLPNILVKGGDYVPEKIVGYDIVVANGGEVLVMPFIDGKSSTDIITKISKL